MLSKKKCEILVKKFYLENPDMFNIYKIMENRRKKWEFLDSHISRNYMISDYYTICNMENYALDVRLRPDDLDNDLVGNLVKVKDAVCVKLIKFDNSKWVSNDCDNFYYDDSDIIEEYNFMYDTKRGKCLFIFGKRNKTKAPVKKIGTI